MVKIIGIFAIVFVYYCEINAELDNLQYFYWKTPTANGRRILSSKKTFPGNKSVGINLRSNEAQPHTKFTTGFREDIKDQHKEYVLRNGVARYYDLEHNVVKKRRFKRNYRYDEYNQIEYNQIEHDSERKKLKKKKKHHHHSRRKVNKNHNSTRNKKTKLYKNEDRNLHKDKKLNKEKNYSGKRKRDKNHSKYSEHLKDMSMSHKRVRDHIHKKKKSKDKRKDEQRDKSMDRNKHATRGGSMTTSKMGMMSLTNKNDHKHNKKQKLNKTKDNDHKHNRKQKLNKTKDNQQEKSMDRNKHTTTGGPMRISQMGMMSPANENDHKQNKKQKLNKIKEKQREKSKHTIDTNKTAIGIAGLGAAGALVGKSLPWKSIKEPKLQSEEVLTSTRTPKPPPGPIKLIKRERSNLRTKEKIRVTKMIPFSLNKQEDGGKEKLRHKSEDSGSPSAGSPPSYLSPYAITAQMELLMNEFPEVNATVTKVGRTVEYNDIVLVSITAKKQDDTYFRAKESKYVDDVPEKKIIFIVHGLTVMGLKDMTSLVKSSELKILLSYYFEHLDKFDFFLMPLANPDGYSASLSSDRTIWNKNVSPQAVCPGVFVDRNFDVAWNHTKEVSSCSQLYPGATPFSEEESKVVRDVLHQFSHKILAYIHVHAGTFGYNVFKGDAILYPRGFIETQSDDDKYIDIKGEVDEAMKNASFRVMSATVDTLSNWYGVVTGTSVDYAATVFGISYAMEFVMQLYDSETLNNNALTEIWSRLIDATFNKMWKSQQGGSDAR